MPARSALLPRSAVSQKPFFRAPICFMSPRTGPESVCFFGKQRGENPQHLRRPGQLTLTRPQNLLGLQTLQ